MEAWLHYGVLAISGNGSELLQKITRLPLNRRKIWEEALQSEWFRTVNVNITNVNAHWENEPSLLRLKDAVNLACIEETSRRMYLCCRWRVLEILPRRRFRGLSL